MADKPVLDNHTYDVAKKAIMVTIPIMVSMYVALAKIFEWPYPEDVTSVVVALTAVVGTILHISSKNFNSQSEDELAGTIDITETPEGGRKVLFAFKDDEVAENLDQRDKVTFKVNVV